MFYEYALEPAVLSSWDRTRFFLDAFGPWKGRFLAEYPRRWKRDVFEGLNCPDVEKKRITERLQRLDKRVFSPRANAPYEPSRAWIDNALLEHQRQPFRAIVASLESAEPHVLDASQVDDTCELWRVESGQFVSREPAAFLQAVGLLLDASSRVVVIDPYFRADQDDKTQPLVAFCRHVQGRAVIEVHFSEDPRSYEICMRDAARALPRLLPAGMKVTLHCWKEREGGPRLHNRYILTEIGGVKFGDSIELGGTGHEDHLSILDKPSWEKLWDQYAGPTPTFDPAGPSLEFVGGFRRGRA